MRTPPRTICVLVSGGLDSALLLNRLLRRGMRVVPVYVQCGLSWEREELRALRRFLRAIESPRVAPLVAVALPLRSLYRRHWSVAGPPPGARTDDRAVELPGRNIWLMSAAALLCAQRGLRTIAVGTLRGNPFGDATPAFFQALAACLTRALRHRLRIEVPLIRSTKAQLIREAGDSVPLQLTVSCLRPLGLAHCGRCNKCAERRRAFRAAGVADPTRYRA